MKSVNIQPAAAAEADEAAAWYEAEQPDLGFEFLLELDAAIEKAAENPLAYAPVFSKLVAFLFDAFRTRSISLTTTRSWKSSQFFINGAPVLFGNRECIVSA